METSIISTCYPRQILIAGLRIQLWQQSGSSNLPSRTIYYPLEMPEILGTNLLPEFCTSWRLSYARHLRAKP